MELKSPLTVKNGSTLSIQQPSGNGFTSNSQNIPNRYNNRNILRTNTLQPQQQRVMRALSERPQNVIGGYDTDTGVLNYNKQLGFNRNNYKASNGDIDSDIEGSKVPNRPQYNNNSTYKSYIDSNGYDTDTGLINARKSLNRRLTNTNTEQKISYPTFMKNSSNKLDVNSNHKLNADISSRNSPINDGKLINVEKNNKINDINENNDINKSAFHAISLKKNDKLLRNVNPDSKLSNK